MALKHLSLGFSCVPVLSVQLGAGCFRLAFSGFDEPGSATVSFATVNRKFQPKTKSSGLGAFPAAKHFPFAINVPVLLARLGVVCFRLAASGFDGSGSAAVSFATVNRKFQPKTKPSGLGCFSTARRFPVVSAGRGCKRFACSAAFPANLSNTAVKAAPSGRWTLRDKAPRSAPYLQSYAAQDAATD